MTDYICPNCRGGFPQNGDEVGCPWCGQIFGEYEPPEDPVISRVEHKAPDEVNLRPAQHSDLELMLAWRSDEEIYRHFRDQNEPLEWESHVSWFKSRDADRHDWIIEYNGRRVGVVCVTPTNEVGIYIGEKSLWGHGVATNALAKACANIETPLTAEIHEENIHSQKLFKTAGFTRNSHNGEWITYTLDSEPDMG